MSTLTIAAAQSTSIKGDISENIRRHAQLVALAKEYGSDVVVFPELSLTGYEPTIASETAVDSSDGVLRPLKDLSDDSKVVVIAGCPIRSTYEKPFIGMLIFQPGRAVAVYRKRFVHSSEEQYFVPSDDTFVFSARGTAIGVAICADINNPTHPADAAKHGAKIYAAGVAKTTREISEAEANMVSYAKRYSMLTVMANYASSTGGFPTAGGSAVWDETGELVARAEPQGECIVLAQKTSDGWAGNVLKP